MLVEGGGGTSHISTLESSDEGGRAVRRWLELPTCIRDGGGAVQQWPELSTFWREEGGEVWLKGEANLP
jgi:hypothetical protein